MATIIWSRSASGDLKKIAVYIANDSAKAAKAQVATLIKRAKILEKFPEIGRPVPELKDIHFRQILEGRYRIIYQLLNDEVHILAVHHQSMLLHNNPVFKSKLE